MTAALRVSTVGMSHEDWLQLRNKGIGGSDAASVLGLNPYKSNFALWEEKVGLREPDDLSENEAVLWGNLLEPIVAEEFARRTGRKTRRVNALLRNPQHPFMLANLDREVAAEDGGEPEILECKTAGLWAAKAEEWGPSGTDLVPERYLCQAMHYLAVTGRKRAHLASLIGGQELRIYTVNRNDELISVLIERESEFWSQVEKHVAPIILDLADAKRRFPISQEAEIEANTETFDAYLELCAAKRDEKSATATVKALQGKIGGYMGDRDTLMRHGQRLLTWKTVERKGYSVAPSSTRQFRLVGED
jgi:putative phage-type endonuclease